MVLLVKYVHAFCTCPLLTRSQSFEILLNLDLVPPIPNTCRTSKINFFYSNLRFFQLDDTIELYPVKFINRLENVVSINRNSYIFFCSIYFCIRYWHILHHVAQDVFWHFLNIKNYFLNIFTYNDKL